MPDDRRILLLRGVNVGANRRLPMADLRAVLTGLGLADVRTHIQSGNAVFRAGPGDWAGRISAAIGARVGFTPESLVLTRDAFASVLAANPFAVCDPGTVHIGFLARPAMVDATGLQALAVPDEQMVLTDAAFYLHAPSGIGRSKLASGAERRLGVPMTMRNGRVAAAIAALAAEE